MLAVEDIGKFGELIFNSSNCCSLPMFYKSVKLISHDSVDLMQGLFEHSCRYSQVLKTSRVVVILD